jgi:hypothetical protein
MEASMIGGIIGSVVGAGIQSKAASKAANAQKAAADEQVALQREIYDDQTQRFEPYYGAGDNALAAYMYELGLGPAPTYGGYTPEVMEVPGSAASTQVGPATPRTGFRMPYDRSEQSTYGYDTATWRGVQDQQGQGFVPPWGNQTSTPATATTYRVGDQVFTTREAAEAYANANKTGGTTYGGYTKTPGYDFRLKQGTDAIEASRAVGSGLVSGRVLQDLNEYGQDYATAEYANHLNRLAGMTDMGMSAAGMQATAGSNFASGASNALGAKGDAAAAGAIGVGNAFSNGIQNGIGVWQYQQGLSKNALNSTPYTLY